jgi:hypothetical protein
MPQARMAQQYQTPYGVTPPMALRSPINPQILAAQRAAQAAIPTQRPVVPAINPMLARVAANAAKMRQAQAEPTAPAGAAQAGVSGAGAGVSAGGLPSSLGEAFSADLMSPTGQAITQASLAGLAAGGWSPTPVTFGQGIAAMGSAAQKAYAAGLEAKRKQDAAAFEQKLKLMQFAQKEREIAGTAGKEAFGNEKQLRGEFDKQAKTFDEALLGFEKVQKAAMADEPTGATDIALIFGYMKVIDPTSVVREGEFATAENAGGIGSKLRNLYNKVVEGQRLSQDVRNDFVTAARTQFQPYLDMQSSVESRYTNLSEAYGLDPKKVVLSRLPKTGSLARPYTSFASMREAQAANLPKGTYVMIGGQLFVED